MADSRRELILLEIERRLKRISVVNGYHRDVACVERMAHFVEDDREWRSKLVGSESILIESSNGRGNFEIDGEKREKETVRINRYFTGGTVTDPDLSQALADLERALFTTDAGDFTLGFYGGEANQVDTDWRTIDPETGATEDGLVYLLTFRYQLDPADGAQTGHGS